MAELNHTISPCLAQRLALGHPSRFIIVDVDHAVVAEGVDPCHLGPGAQIGGDCPHVSFDLEVDGLSARVKLVPHTAAAVIVRMQLGRGHHRHCAKSGLNVLQDTTQASRQAIHGH